MNSVSSHLIAILTLPLTSSHPISSYFCSFSPLFSKPLSFHLKEDRSTTNFKSSGGPLQSFGAEIKKRCVAILRIGPRNLRKTSSPNLLSVSSLILSLLALLFRHRIVSYSIVSYLYLIPCCLIFLSS